MEQADKRLSTLGQGHQGAGRWHMQPSLCAGWEPRYPDPGAGPGSGLLSKQQVGRPERRSWAPTWGAGLPSSGGLTFPALLLPRHGRWLSQYRKEQAWERTWHTWDFFSCWGHRLMQPGTFQLTHRSLPPGPLCEILRNPLAGNTIHAGPGRETAAPATRQGLAHGDTRSSHLLFLILACTATGQSTVCQLSQMGLPPPP